MIRPASLFVIALFLSASALLAQGSGEPRFPYNVKRDWKLLPDKTVSGYLVQPKAQNLTPGVLLMTTELGVEPSRVPRSALHPEDLAWIDDALEWVRYMESPPPEPDSAIYNLPSLPSDRFAFPDFNYLELGERPGIISRVLASYSLWWDTVGFLPIERGGDLREKAAWAYDLADRALSENSDNSWSLERAQRDLVEYFERAYAKEVVFTSRLLTYVGPSTLSEYTNGYDCIALKMRISDGPRIQYGDLVPVISATEQGDLEFHYLGERIRGRILEIPVEEKFARQLSPGAMEIQILNREDLTQALTDPDNRVFLNPDGLDMAWIIRPYRLTDEKYASLQHPLIPPPDMSSYVPKGSIAITPKAIEEEEEAPSGPSPYQPNSTGFKTSTPNVVRMWTSKDGKTMRASYVGWTDSEDSDEPKRTFKLGSQSTQLDLFDFSREDQLYIYFRDCNPSERSPFRIRPRWDSGRCLYRISKLNEPDSAWIEIHFTKTKVFASIQIGEEFEETGADGIQEARLAFQEPNKDMFRIDLEKMEYESVVQSSSTRFTNPISPALLSIPDRHPGAGFGPATDPGGYLALLRWSSPTNHLGLPVRSLAGPSMRAIVQPGYDANLVAATLFDSPVPVFWKFFLNLSQSPHCATMIRATQMIDFCFQTGMTPMEVLMRNQQDHSEAFQIMLEEIEYEFSAED
ncbi:MAG: hypothetical protein AAF491_05220 [Verrucomicrobiota bacterium]